MAGEAALIRPILERPVEARAVALALGFLVDIGNISRAGGDLLEPLVFAAIVQANQAALRHDPEAQARYGDSGEAIPDDLRRPISAHAVAQSLRLPFETVRRKARTLRDRGQVVSTSAGLYVPRAVITGPEHAAIQEARLARLLAFHDELAQAGLLSADEALERPLPMSLKRNANRALSEYMLRTSDRLSGLAGGLLEGFVLLGLAAVNLERPGELAPCSNRRLSTRIGMPLETVRRRLLALEANGHARRIPRGWLADAPASEAERIAQLKADHDADLRRLFARLKELAAANPAD